MFLLWMLTVLKNFMYRRQAKSTYPSVPQYTLTCSVWQKDSYGQQHALYHMRLPCHRRRSIRDVLCFGCLVFGSLYFHHYQHIWNLVLQAWPLWTSWSTRARSWLWPSWTREPSLVKHYQSDWMGSFWLLCDLPSIFCRPFPFLVFNYMYLLIG